jgi:hypothetical protein
MHSLIFLTFKTSKIMVVNSFTQITTVDIEDIAPNKAQASEEQVSIAKEIGQTAIPVGYLADERMILGHNAERGIHLVTHEEAFNLAVQTGAPRISVILLPKDQALRIGAIYQ